ncbi:MAG: sensor histidine kinase [Marvinbryantia sp.]|jgi:two-component system sensor histidine kinase YesM
MAKEKERKKVQSLKSVSLKLLIPLGIAVTALLAFLILGLWENRRLANDYVKDTAELYVGQINRDFSQINSELVYVSKQNRDIRQLPSTLDPKEASQYETFNSIIEQNRILKIRYEEVQLFYVFEQEAEVLITDSGVIFPSSVQTDLYQELIRVLNEQASVHVNTTNWSLLKVQEKTYIISWYTNRNKTMGCVIDLERIFEILQNGIRNYEVIPFVKDREGRILLPEGISEEHKARILSGSEEHLHSYTLGGVGQIHLYIVPGSGMLERILVLQMLFVALIIALLIFCLVIAYNYYNKIMTPMRDFVEALENMNEEQMLNENGTNNILELEFASGKFRTLLRKIQSLKIAIYEKELKEQQAELEYVQEQVRPHFLLNCLSVIHGKADEKGETEIVRITEVLSDYMRYVIKDSKNQRVIREELAHIAFYVEMQKLRYGEEAFSYETILDGKVEDCLVPPLLLQTLVENAIVHGVTLDNKIEISLYITSEDYEDGSYLYISVSDTGRGFSQETLEALENDSPIIYGGRKHVGLQNVRRRLELLYGGRAGITFSNMGENYGAVVEVHLPMTTEREAGSNS